MPDLNILRELIKKKALVEIEEGLYGKPQTRLIEPENPERPEYGVKINNIPKNSIVIKADAFPAPKNMFNGDKGECKRADFVIITNTGARRFIIFIEMKKGTGDRKKIIQQLKGAQCMIDYFRSIVNLFWKKTNFLATDQWEYRFVSISHIGANKQPTFDQPGSSDDIHNQAERMLKISAPGNIQFNKLIGKHR